MTNSLAISLVILIAAALAIDYTFFDWAGSVFMAKRGIDLIQYLAIWR